MSAGPRSRFRRDIEGLRAVAVLLVLLYHVGVAPFGGGFVGVDVFFVISGYLITSLLLKEAEATGTVSLLNFYARRARRLLPAATVVLVVTAAAGYLVLPRVQLANLAADVAAAAVYVVNWTLGWRAVDYLAEDAAVSPIQHFWSLSVEEQYYLFWPLLIIAVLAVGRLLGRWQPRALTGTAIALISLASFVWSVHYTAADAQMAFFATPTRIWELGIGALIAVALPALQRLPRLVSELLAATGLLAIVLSALLHNAQTPWPGTAALVPVLGAAAVVAAGCAHADTRAGRALGVAPMTWIGGISYSVYLWHWPLIIFAAHLWPGLPTVLVVLIGAVSLPLAALTRRYVEDPIRYDRTLSRRPSRALAMGAGGMVLSLVAAGAVYATAPEQQAAPAAGAGALALVADRQAEGIAEVVEDPAASFTTTGPVSPDPLRATEDIPGYYDDDCQAWQERTEPMLDCVYGVPDGEVTVAVLGDSKMGQWLPALELIAEQERWRLELYIKSACSFRPEGQYEECNEWNANVAAHLAEHPVDVAIVSGGTSTTADVRAPTEADPAIAGGMTESWTRLREAGVNVVMLEDNPAPDSSAMPGDPASVYECVAEHPDDYAVCTFPYNQGNGTAALREAARATGAPGIDLSPWICPGHDVCPPVIGEVLVYRQGTHLTASYVRTLAPLLHRELIAIDVASAEPLPLVDEPVR